jgi:hypothetical protein
MLTTRRTFLTMKIVRNQLVPMTEAVRINFLKKNVPPVATPNRYFKSKFHDPGSEKKKQNYLTKGTRPEDRLFVRKKIVEQCARKLASHFRQRTATPRAKCEDF